MILTNFLYILLIFVIFIGVFAYYWFGEYLSNKQFKAYWKQHNQKYPELQLFLTALDENNVECIETLIKGGLDVNKIYEFYNESLQEPDYTTLFLRAIAQNKPEIVALCLENGADVNARNHLNQSPLMLTKNPTVAKLLREFGATND